MRNRYVRVAITVVAASVLAIAMGHAAAPTAFGIASRANEYVSLAARGRFVAAVWAASTPAGDTDIYATVSRDAGATFSAPARVTSTAGTARVNGEQPPRVVLVPRPAGDPTMVAVWTAKGSSGTVLLTARSADGGRTFNAAAVVPGTDAAGNRGWEAIVADAGGNVDAIWLDHRETAASMDMSHHMDHAPSSSTQADSVAKAQLSKLYFGQIGGRSPARAVASGVCYCCKTAIAVGPDNAIYAAWRHVYPGNLRDIAFTMSRDGGRTFAAPIRVSEDQWAIDGCPENGPALAIDSKSTVHVAWPTLTGGGPNSPGSLEVFYASSRDGRQFTPRERVPTSGTPRHVQLATLANGGILLVWDETSPAGHLIALASGALPANGRVTLHRQTLQALGDAVYPSLTITSDGALVAATSAAAEHAQVRVATVHLEGR